MSFRLSTIKMPPWEAILTRCMLAWLMWEALYDSAPPWTSQPHPIGLGAFFDFTWLAGEGAYPAFLLAAKIGLVLFAIGLFPPVAILGFLVVDISLHTLASSQGFKGHGAQINCLLALGMLGGYLGYYVYNAVRSRPWFSSLALDLGKPAETALQGARVVLAATYVVSALTKLSKGGLDWSLKGDAFLLQVLKAQDEMRATHINPELTQAAVNFADYLAHHTWLANLMLSGALFLELFAFLALLGRRWALLFGVGLLLFHKSNHWLMGLPFKGNQWALWFLFIMPLHWLVWAGKAVTGTHPGSGQKSAAAENTNGVPLWRKVLTHPALIAIVLAVFLLWRGEWYPFSNFPMYSSLKPSTNSLLAMDMQGQVIPFEKLGTNAPTVKKTLRTELEVLRKAGLFDKINDAPPDAYQKAIQKVVSSMIETPGHAMQHHTGFRIVRKDYEAVKGEVKITSQILAEFPQPGSAEVSQQAAPGSS